MALSKIPDGEGTEDQLDSQLTSDLPVAEEPRIRNLNSNIRMPPSDILMSDGEEVVTVGITAQAVNLESPINIINQNIPSTTISRPSNAPPPSSSRASRPGKLKKIAPKNQESSPTFPRVEISPRPAKRLRERVSLGARGLPQGTKGNKRPIPETPLSSGDISNKRVLRSQVPQKSNDVNATPNEITVQRNEVSAEPAPALEGRMATQSLQTSSAPPENLHVDTSRVQSSSGNDDNDDGLHDSPTTYPTQHQEEQRHTNVPISDMDKAEIYFRESDGIGIDNEDEIEHSEEDLDRRDKPPMPKAMETAFDYAREIHDSAKETQIARSFRDSDILKDHDVLVKNIRRLEAREDYDKVDRIIKSTNLITGKAKAIVDQPSWDQERFVVYVYARVMPTIVRMLYNSLSYHLSAAGSMEQLSCEQLKASRNMMVTVVAMADKAKQSKKVDLGFPHLKTTSSMIARIRKVLVIFKKREVAIKQAQAEAESSERQQRQQEKDNLDLEATRKLQEWRAHWQALHTQRRGAELEGRKYMDPTRIRYLALVPLEEVGRPGSRLDSSTGEYIEFPEWDLDTQVIPLMDGLKEFTGPDVYRYVFRKYCGRGGPLQAFNVSEIVDKAVSMRDGLCVEGATNGEDVEQWIRDIPDPRKRPRVSV